MPKRLRRRASADTKIMKIDGGSPAVGSLELTITIPEGYHFSKELGSCEQIDVETEPADAITFERSSGIIDATGSVSLKFVRRSPSPASCRVNCKVNIFSLKESSWIESGE
ncbi:hypothetical protein KSP40_PGU022814 [Platanthera guangdongensis]|uniref:Uncharacterized protein n=1 Tax=Platanthera guangdongensis TaxID=2320717 RepID=A0ABR2LGG5_9ASPA